MVTLIEKLTENSSNYVCLIYQHPALHPVCSVLFKKKKKKSMVPRLDDTAALGSFTEWLIFQNTTFSFSTCFFW